jgi:uncharacterized membrane protein
MNSSRLPARHDGLAIASLVLSLTVPLIGSLLAVIFGHMSRSQAMRERRQASGIATAGMILGYIGLAAFVIVIIVIVVTATSSPDPTQQWVDCINAQLNNPQLVCPPSP